MVTRSQRHKEEVHGWIGPPAPPVDEITITQLSPGTGPANTTMKLAVLGQGFELGDEIVFGGSVHQSHYTHSGQIETSDNDPIATGAARTVPVTVVRGSIVSNSLPFTVFVPAPTLDALFNRGAVSPGNGNADEPVTIGMTFYTVGGLTGKVHRVSFWKPANDVVTARQVGVYNQAGAKVASGATTGEPAGPTWIDVTLAAPLSIVSGAYYTAAVHFPSANYPAQAGGFTVDPKPSVSGKFYAASTGEHYGNGTFTYGASLTFPIAGTPGANFWVDIGFEADAA